MKTLVVFFILSISAFSAPPDATELKVRQIWADHYKKEGYHFDIKKMSAADMETAYEIAELKKKLEVAKNQPESAIPETATHEAERYKVSASKGILDGIMGLASCYYSGKGVPQSYVEAAKWSQKAIDQANKSPGASLGPLGIWQCHSILGECYLEGRGVSKDVTKGVALFRKAAEEGDAFCQYDLGKCYANGIGVPKDDVLAYMWLNLSATGGNPIIMKFRDRLASEMSGEQIAEAQRMCREWKPKGAGN